MLRCTASPEDRNILIDHVAARASWEWSRFGTREQDLSDDVAMFVRWA